MKRVQFCTALHTLLMMTANMLSKRLVSRIIAALLFFLNVKNIFYEETLPFAESGNRR